MNILETFNTLDTLYESDESDLINDSKKRIEQLLLKPYAEALAQVKESIEEACDVNGMDITITGIDFTGSRRFGKPRARSDLDVVFTYTSNGERVREDDLFTCLCDPYGDGSMYYEGFKLDINPLEDADIEEYIKNASTFRKR